MKSGGRKEYIKVAAQTQQTTAKGMQAAFEGVLLKELVRGRHV
jgi:hypothetical protein